MFPLIFIERGRERERNMDVREELRSVASYMCPNQELNP